MYLAEIRAQNFRIFGSSPDTKLHLRLQPGLNVLIGENDGGKTAIIDVVRICLLTTSHERHWFLEDDFHCDAQGRTQEIILQCKFEDLRSSLKSI